MRFQNSLYFTLLLISPFSIAHHSSSPHFDFSKAVLIDGIVVEFEQRNPHAYVHIQAEDADGLSHVYRCESHGVTQLERNGISRDMLAVGERIAVDGIQHRRDPYQCFFNNVYLADGRKLSINGGRSSREPDVAQRDSIYGTWLLAPSILGGGDSVVIEIALTPAGIEAVLAYEPLKDDPTYRCEPVVPHRVWFAPGTPMSITREGNSLFLQHEWMDVVREVHLDLDEHPKGGEKTLLGHSIGHFEGDVLVIEAANFSEGVLRQYVEQADGSVVGLLHSESYTTIEKIRFDSKSNRIEVTIEQNDPLYFTTGFNLSVGEYAASDLEIQPFGCIPEVLI